MQQFTASGRPLRCWAVVNFTHTPQHVVTNFVTFLVQTLRGLGVDVVNAEPVYIDASRTQDPPSVREALKNAGREAHFQAKALSGGEAMNPDMFLCVMDRVDASFYDAIKRACA